MLTIILLTVVFTVFALGALGGIYVMFSSSARNKEISINFIYPENRNEEA